MRTRTTVVSIGALLALAGAAQADISALGLLFPFDSNNTGAWANSMARNDDGSSAVINTGFDFCFYGQNRSNLFINNNGNISFDTPYSTFTPTGFPDATFQMIAPFWADVDTRNANNGGIETNQVWHRSFDTNADAQPDTFVVTWDAVGFYSTNNSLRNTFQVAITSNPAQWGGRNVAFSYGEMQWTTGDASQGSGGFGGSPATVGINQGNGVDFFQVGRFDHAGNDYDGSGGNNDGVSFLDNRDFFFDICGIANVPPVAAGLPSGNCYQVNVGDSLSAVITLIGPELGDAITAISVLDLDSAQAAGLSIITALGDPGTVTLNWTPDAGDMGLYDFDLIFSDSFGNTTTERFCIEVVPAPTSAGLLALAGLFAARRRRA